jgi:TolB-like protein/Tfp pilus assembly protein PilF
MLTGEVPFNADHEQAVIYSVINSDVRPVTELRPDVPEHLLEIVTRALRKNPDDRFANAAEMRRELQSPTADGSAPEKAAAEQRSIAVLPFTNMSADKEQDYFCDGIAEDITNDLATVGNLRVAARTSAFAYKGRHKDIREIGRELGVETILEGSVRKAANQLRITAQLVSIADGYHLWSERYDRELKDVFAIQDEIARNIVQALKIQLSDSEKEALDKARTPDVEAYDFYLRGRNFFYILYGRNLDYAIEMFGRAIERDPNYALAHAGLADAHSFHFMYGSGKQQHLESAMSASQKALDIDPKLADAHAARGLAVSLSQRYDEAEREFEEAIRLCPSLFEAYYFYARTCHAQGKHDKAAEFYEKASRANPEDYQAPILLAQAYHAIGELEKEKRAGRLGLELARRRLERYPEDVRARLLGAHAFAHIGREEEALDWGERALALTPDDSASHYNVACLYARFGYADPAFDHLEKAFDRGYAHKAWVENDPDFDAFRDHPRFKELLSKLGD